MFRMDAKTVLTATICGAAIGITGSYYIQKQQNTDMLRRINQSPPIVVVDFLKIASRFPNGADSSDVEKLMSSTKDAITKLRNNGYLVLDASHIVSAPNDIYLPDSLLKSPPKK